MPITRFVRGRGRPRAAPRQHADLGTPELIFKRLLHHTAEVLDLCLERRIISPGQHWCGIHLRWLYTIRYGAPGVHAIDPTHLGGRELASDDLQWRAAREREYHDAILHLRRTRHDRVMLDCCVHNERPRFLLLPHAGTICQDEINHFQNGFDLLSRHWRRK